MRLFIIAACATQTSSSSSVALRSMVHIDWKRLPDIPKQGPSKSGFQDSDGGYIDDNTVLTAFGYSSGGVAGFLNSAWLLNTSKMVSNRPAHAAPNTTCNYELHNDGYSPIMCYTAQRLFPSAACAALTCHGVAAHCDLATGFCINDKNTRPCLSGAQPQHPTPVPPPSPWQQLPSAPVNGRQEVSAAIIDGAVYFVGGFSYKAPYTFNETLKLARDPASGEWKWTRLPDFPYPVSSYGMTSIGWAIQ